MPVRFIHTSDVHLGKTYRASGCDAQRYQDFFTTFAAIVTDAVREQVDFVLIGGDLFHTGQILPRTFAKTIEILQPLKDAGIPCLAVEGNHDWIHRRDSVSWMEALSQLGYISLLRPSRSADGGYLFDAFDPEQGSGGHIEVKGVNIYGLGYIGSQAGNHVPRICDAISTRRNILLFHVGVWTYSPVEIGNIKPEEAQPLAACFDYVALGHGHKPYIVNDADGRPYAFNPGSPDCVNFGEERYDKGYYLVALDQDGKVQHEFRRTTPRPMLVVTANLDGAGNATDALELFKAQMAQKLAGCADDRAPLVEVRLAGKVGFHPFELSRDRLRASLCEICEPLHLEIKNHLSLVAGGGEEKVKKSLAEIERDVLGELIGANSHYQGRVDELTRLSLALRDLVLKGDVEGEELLSLLSSGGDQCA